MADEERRSEERRSRSPSPRRASRSRSPRRSRSRSPPRRSSRSPPRNDARRSRSRSPRRRSRSPPRGDRCTGVAVRWNDRGFGFIKPDDGGDDIFCHVSAIKDGKRLIEGGKVEFNKQYDDRKGKDRAEDVTGGAPDDAPSYGGGGRGYDRYDDRRGGYDRYDDRRGGDRYDDRRGGGGYDRPPPTSRPGDWACPECHSNVFASKTACYKCGAPKPGGGGGDDRYDRDRGDRDRGYSDRDRGYDRDRYR